MAYNKQKYSKSSSSKSSGGGKQFKGTVDRWTSGLIKSVGNFNWNNPLGLPVDLTKSTNNTGAIPAAYGDTSDSVIPGFVRIGFAPTFGVSTNAASALNVCANKIYTSVRYANSGATNYENSDLMIYLLCVASLYNWYYVNARAYGRMRVYSMHNRYVAQAELSAMGMNYANLSADMPGWRAYLDVLRGKINSFKVPKEFKMFYRQQILCGGIFKDAEDDKHQDYFFMPDWYYKFALDSSSRGMAEAIPAPTINTLADIITFSDTLMSPIFMDDDFNIMSGDIKKAFSDYAELPEVPDGYFLEAEYDTDILHKIENATVFYSGTWKSGSLDVTQTVTPGYDPYLVCNPTFWTAQRGYEIKKLLTCDHDDPSPEETVELSRFTLIPKAYAASGDSTNPVEYTFDQTGTEILTSARIYHFTTAGVLNNIAVGTVLPRASTGAAMARQLAEIELFSHIFRPVVVYTTSSATTIDCRPVGDLENYYAIDPSELAKIHEASLMHEFNLL